MTDTSTEEARITPSCVEALQNYEQADYEGIMVLASRQAIHETIDAYWERVDACNALAAERDKWHAGWMEAEAKVSELEAERDALKADRDEAAMALRDVLAGKSVRNADEIIARAALQEKTDG